MTSNSLRESVPEQSLEENKAALQLLSNRLVEYFVVYSCKPRRRNKDENSDKGGDLSQKGVNHGEKGEEKKEAPNDGNPGDDQPEMIKASNDHDHITTPVESPQSPRLRKTSCRAVHFKVAPDGGIARKQAKNDREGFELDCNIDEGTPLVTAPLEQDVGLNSEVSDGMPISVAPHALRGIRVPVASDKEADSDTVSKETDSDAVSDTDDYIDEYQIRGDLPATPPSKREKSLNNGEDVYTPSRLRAMDSDSDDEVDIIKEEVKTADEFTPTIVDNNAVDSKTRTEPSNTAGNIHLPSPTGSTDEEKRGEIPSEFTLLPVQTARYPATDHSDCPLNPMISHFCFPQKLNLSLEYHMPRIHYFVLTNEKGKKIYGTCLTFWEKFVQDGDGGDGAFDEDALASSLKSKGVVHDNSGSQDIEVTLSSDDDGPTVIYCPKVLCIISCWPYLHSFREYLGQLYRLATMTNMMNSPIEKYVINICSETPAPPPGKFELRMKILNSTLKFWAPPGNQPIAYVALPFEVLFECLDINNVIFVWYALTLERKVLLVSSQFSLLTVCSEILCSLLYPFQFCHLYIPIVPKFLTPMLEAPMPYLCGITRENFSHAINDICDETIVVDLDQNLITMGNITPPLPPMPLKRRSKLERALQKSAGDVFWSARGLSRSIMSNKDDAGVVQPEAFTKTASRVWREKLVGYDNAFNMAFTPDSETLLNGDTRQNLNGSEKMEQSQWDSVQEAFLRFYVSMLRDYTKYITGSLNDRTFRSDRFITSQKADHRHFLKEFCYTQQFDGYLTKRLFSPNEPDVLFFDQSITAKKNRSKMKLRKVETPFLHSAKAHKKLRTVEALEPIEDIADTSDTNLLDRFYSPGSEDEKVTHQYDSWPESFDQSLFGTPRPIPVAIAAEFERMQSLSNNMSVRTSGHFEEEEFCPGISYPSHEVATFTLFFAIFCDAVVGKEFELLRNRFRENLPHGSYQEPKSLISRAKQTVEVERKQKMNPLVADCQRNVCSPCSGGTVASNTITDETIATLHLLEEKRTRDEKQNFTMLAADKVSEEDVEAAQLVATGQLDLAFSCLEAISLRSLPADQDSLRLLMAACGRCGSTGRATQLITMMKEQALPVDSEIYSNYLTAFSVVNEINPDEPIQSPFAKVPLYGPTFNPNVIKIEMPRMKWFGRSFKNRRRQPVMSDRSDQQYSLESSTSSSATGEFRSESSGGGRRKLSSGRLGTPLHGRRSRAQKNQNNLATTDTIERHIAIGNSLLDYLYAGLKIKDNGDTCPQCAIFLETDQLMKGWRSCSFVEYTTECPHCKHRFIPRFVVISDSPNFTGSRGIGTPLYCEFFSPWVLRRELHEIGFQSDLGEGMCPILKPEWRHGNDFNAKLWWNVVILFRRHKLPLTFLLQGSFRDRLIMPMP